MGWVENLQQIETEYPEASTEYPIASTCPKCGSREFEEVDSFINPESIRAELGFYYDRKCTACGTRYTPRAPLWAAVLIIVLCIPFLPVFILLIYKAVDLFRKGLRFIRRQDKPITSDASITSLPRL